ncbi:hypothetical protein GBA52_014546, partial [Prunus armeniaca]
VEQGLLARLEKILGSSGASAPNEAQEIYVGRGGVTRTMSFLKTTSVVMCSLPWLGSCQDGDCWCR